jgi:hypothetical protein
MADKSGNLVLHAADLNAAIEELEGELLEAVKK